MSPIVQITIVRWHNVRDYVTDSIDDVFRDFEPPPFDHIIRGRVASRWRHLLRAVVLVPLYLWCVGVALLIVAIGAALRAVLPKLLHAITAGVVRVMYIGIKEPTP